jgi:arabinofuranosyltransferase
LKDLSPRVSLSLVALIIGVFLFRVADHFPYTPDDTYIYLQYARNLIEGNGWSFNPGEPTYGFTSPLWLLLIAGAGGLGMDVYASAKVMDIIAAVAALVVLFIMSLRIAGRRYMAVLIVLCFSVNLWFVRWAGSGMETSLSVLLALLAVDALLQQRAALSGLLMGLLVLTRPEAAVLACLALCSMAIGARRGQRFSTSLRYGLGCMVPVAVWLWIAHDQFGSIVANTARAKAGFKLEFEDLLHNVLDIGQTVGVADGLGMLVLVAALGMVLIKRDVDQQSWLTRHWVLLAWIVALPALYLVTSANVVSRYLLIMTPFIAVYAFVLVGNLAPSAPRYVVVLASVLVIQNAAVYEWRVRPAMVAFQEGMEECFIAIGEWLKHNTPEDAVVYVADIGAIGYYSQRKVCDGAGLVTPAFIPYIRQGVSSQHILESDLLREICDPQYIVHRAPPGTLLDGTQFRAVFSRPFHGLGLSDTRTVHYTVYETMR